MEKFGVSQPVRRREDYRFLAGAGEFVDDIKIDSIAFVEIVRSPHASAKIIQVSVDKARRTSGVLRVITAVDIAENGLGDLKCLAPVTVKEGTEFCSFDQPILAQRIVRYVGEPIVVIVAETKEKAKLGAELIDIEFEILPAVINSALAASKEAPRLFSISQSNVSFNHLKGDQSAVDAAFANASRVVSLDLVNNRVVLSAIEGRGCIAEYDPAGCAGRGKFTLTTTTQMPNSVRDQLADSVFCCDRERIRVRVLDVGGGFGGKNEAYPEYALCMLAAKIVGRPVKWIADRQESFVSDFHGRDNISRIEASFDQDGLITGLRLNTYAALGAYVGGRGPVSPTTNLSVLCNTYTVKNIFVEVLGVVSNTVPTGPYRGAGRPEVIYAIERLIDVAARELEIDRVELRRRNLIPVAAFPYNTPTGLTYEVCDFEMVIDEAMSRAKWASAEKRKSEALARGKWRGLGMANYVERCGGAAGLSETARIRFDESGDAIVYSGSQSNGQGHETAFSQILNEYLGLPFEKIHIIQGDTDLIPVGTGTGGSWSIPMGGGALSLAAKLIIDKARRIFCYMFEVAQEDVYFSDGKFYVIGTDLGMSLVDIAMASHETTNLPDGEKLGLEESAKFKPDNYTYPYGCHVAEVEIDPETGVVELVSYVCVHDFGRALNPDLLAGQVHGGVVQGIGQALHEHTVYHEDGQLLSGSFMDYQIPRADNIPKIDFVHKVTGTEHNLMGSKGCGEAGAAGSPPAVINAVVDALSSLGVKHIDMPATPEKVWETIQKFSVGA